MIPLDYRQPGAEPKKVARPATVEVTERRAWVGMVWYLVYFALVGLVLAWIRTRNL